MEKIRIKRTLLSVISLIGNSVFFLYEFINIFLYMGITAIGALFVGLGGKDFSSLVGMQFGYLIIGISFIILYICSLIAPFKNKIASKGSINKSIIRTAFMVILYGIYYMFFMAEKHEYILVIVLINFIEMCYNLFLNNKKVFSKFD